ncbi:MAG: glycosyltransferase [Kiritimatiellae bacterium]|nr:glycosyltransferase [Kiritimatiellia bacterium]
MTKNEEKWKLTRETIGNGRLSVIMPAYNLENELKKNLAETAALFRSHQVRTELIPVDDGSSDGTELKRICEELGSDDLVVFIPVVLAENGGKGAALKAGFAASTGDYVMLLDGDLDIHPKQTPWFFERLTAKNADIVIGSKRHPKSVVKYPWHRRLVSFIYFSLVRIFLGLKVSDTQTGMKLFKRDILKAALDRMLVKTYAFDLELLAIAADRGASVAEAPVVIRFGSKFGCLRAKTVFDMAKDSLAVFYRLRILKYYAKAEVPRRPTHEPLVSIVIACPNESAMLTECLAAIDKQTYRNFEVIVLPDSKTGKVRPAEKRNLGIKEAKGEIVAFIDDDAYPDVHWLEYAIKYFGEETIGALGGPGVTPLNDSYLSKIGGRIYSNVLVAGSYRYRYVAGGVKRDVDDFPSCNLFVRKSVLDKIGGFRTDFWPGEDTLLCKDIVDSGFRIVYDPWVVVNHHRRAFLGAHLRQLSRYAFHRGYFVKRFPSNSLHLAYFVPSVFVLGFLAIPWLWSLYAIYGILLLITTFALNPLTWILTAFGVFASHLCYGVKFVQGLCAKKAPCEFIGKDHL